MANIESSGKCNLCGGIFGKALMTRHLKTCLQARPSGKLLDHLSKTASAPRNLHLVVRGRRDSEYWLHLHAATDATLRELDSFLRDVWLECCGHMSAVQIGEESYASSPMGEMDDKSLVELRNVLRPRKQIRYEYDFGSTTELLIKVAGEQVAPRKSKSIEILARNAPPLIACTVCGKPALHVCSECSYETGGWLCSACAKKHPCDPHMRLPVVNSPRVGVCGYTG